jgi:DNA invertase Pin-like site-specific DNA recombinase
MATRKNGRRNSSQTKSSRAVGCVRISVRRDDQTSTQTQDESIRHWGASQAIEIVDVFTDEGRSAYKLPWRKRAAVVRAVRLIESGVADCLVCWKLDRVVRDVADLLDLISELDKHGAAFVSVTQPFDTRESYGRVIVLILAVLAELESSTKAERIEVWHDKRLDERALPSGPTPFGFRRERNRLIIVPEEAEVIQKVAIAILNGASLLSQVPLFNAIGRQHSHFEGTKFTPSGVKRVVILIRRKAKYNFNIFLVVTRCRPLLVVCRCLWVRAGSWLRECRDEIEHLRPRWPRRHGSRSLRPLPGP